jgi:hypothetical protein
MAAVYDGELERRVSVLRRFRELLLEQRGKFQKYLKVLDHERADIESGDVDRLVAHVELEEQIVSEIFTFQKVIDPLDELYHAAWSASGHAAAGASPGEGVLEIKAALGELRAEVARRNVENRVLLKQRMELMRAEIAGFRNPIGARRSVFAGEGGGGLVDIRG